MSVHSSKGHDQNDRVSQILRLLGEGKKREDIALSYHYSTWKSLDIYMRRHGFIWNPINNTYILNSTTSEASVTVHEPIQEADKIKPEEIVRLFETGFLDAREIAQKTGFTDHKAMAAYMLQHNYVWSADLKNYVNNSTEKTAEANTDSVITDSVINEALVVQNIPGLNVGTAYLNIEKYASLLEFLWQNREKLLRILETMKVEEQVRIYNVKGPAKTKSLFLTDAICSLMNDFCAKHSLSQKQGYEAAIIEYLSKYGEHEVVSKLLH